MFQRHFFKAILPRYFCVQHLAENTFDISMQDRCTHMSTQLKQKFSETTFNPTICGTYTLVFSILFHFLSTGHNLLMGYNSQIEKHWPQGFQREMTDSTYRLITPPFREPIKMVIKEQNDIDPQGQRHRRGISAGRRLKQVLEDRSPGLITANGKKQSKQKKKKTKNKYTHKTHSATADISVAYHSTCLIVPYNRIQILFKISTFYGKVMSKKTNPIFSSRE